MTHDRIVRQSDFTFSALDHSMPGSFLVSTITSTMHIVVNDPQGESVVRRVCSLTNSECIGDEDWLPAEYSEIRVGEDASFQFVSSPVYGESLIHTNTQRRIPRVVQISLYEGYPALPHSDTFGCPRGLPISTDAVKS